MTRNIVEHALVLRSAQAEVGVLTPAGGGLDRAAEQLARSGVVLFRPASISRSALRGALRAFGPDAVRLCTGAFPPDTRIALRMLGLAPAVVETLHLLPRRLRIKAGQRLFHRLRPTKRYRLLVLSEQMLQEVRQRIPALAPVCRKIDNGVALPASSPAARSASSSGPVRVVTACRLDESHKDVTTLLRAAALVRGRGVEVELLVLGDGPDRPRLEALARELDAPARFEGWVEQPFERIAQCDVAALSTRREGLPRFLVEAQALGLPVVASDAPGCADAVAEGETALLAPPGDAQAMAEALERLVRDAALRRRMGEQAARFVQRFRIERFAVRFAQVVESLLEGASYTQAKP